MNSEWLWRIVAFIVSRRPIADYLIRRAQRTPDFDLPGYMRRDWLFNGYPPEREGDTPAERDAAKRFPRLPAIRIHHIMREDLADHPHDHPWNARTIILRGSYVERRAPNFLGWGQKIYERGRGDTATLNYGEFHHIESVSPGGVFTMFIIGPWCGQWGFLVDGQKMHWREYVAKYPERG